ncbi:MAG: metallophosphoesterase family protein [Planctomycetota bacterium]
MNIGLVSDSHGQAGRLGRAVGELVERGAEAIVHCGDLGSLRCVRALGAAGVPTWATAGNMDRHVAHLAGVAAHSGVTFGRRSAELDLGDGRYLVAVHGHDEDLLAELIGGGQFAYVCHGHTHRRRDDHVGAVHVINPGAVQRAVPHSAALLDTQTDTVTFLEVD